MMDILTEVKLMQESKGVNTEYVFAHLDGSFILPEAYAEYVHSVFQRVGIQGKTSYVFRRGVNQLLDERGVSPTNRAKLLGHTVQTNLTCYTFGSRDIVEIGRQALEANITCSAEPHTPTSP
jgi:integrase